MPYQRSRAQGVYVPKVKVDFENVNNNEFVVCNQFTVIGCRQAVTELRSKRKFDKFRPFFLLFEANIEHI